MKCVQIAVALMGVLISCVCFSSGPKKYSKYEKMILDVEWTGARQYVLDVKKAGGDICVEVQNLEKKFKDANFVLVRILMVSTQAKCTWALDMAKRYLSHSDPLLQAEAIRLSAILNKEERASVSSKIQLLRKNAKDPAVLTALSEYPVE